MKLQITYKEFSELVKAKADKIVELSYVDSKSVNVRYTHMQKVPFCNKYIPISVDVKIRVEGFENGDMFLAYSAGKGLDTIISGVFTLYPGLRNMNIVEMQEEQKAVVHLMKVDKVRDALDKIDIHDICFYEEGVKIEFALK